jgi:hypothetical protein
MSHSTVITGLERRSPPAAHSAIRLSAISAQPALALLQLDLAVDHRRRAGEAERLDQPRHPSVPGDRPVSSSVSSSKSNRSAIIAPRTQRGKLIATRDTGMSRPQHREKQATIKPTAA